MDEYRKNFSYYWINIYSAGKGYKTSINFSHIKKDIDDGYIILDKIAERIDDIPLLAAIRRMKCPQLVKFFKDLWYSETLLLEEPYGYIDIPNVYNKDTKILDVKKSIADIIQWNYINILAENISIHTETESYQNMIDALDEYCKIFDVTYKKGTFDEIFG